MNERTKEGFLKIKEFIGANLGENLATMEDLYDVRTDHSMFKDRADYQIREILATVKRTSQKA